MPKFGLGWRGPDMPDHRDFVYAAPPDILKALPKQIDLRPACPPVYDQGQLGSCTGNAVAGNVQFLWRKQHSHDVVPSRLFDYYCARMLEGTVSVDAGASIRDAIKAVSKYGIPPESEWPYDISAFATRPPQPVWDDALKDQAIQYSRVVRTLSQMKGCLAAGYPFVAGIAVYDSFMSNDVASSGVVFLPQSDEAMLGGHAIMVVGYTEGQRRFLCRNSWAESWGQQGYFTLPYAYLQDKSLSADFWRISLMET